MAYEFRSACTYDNNNPRCLEVATDVPGTVALRDTKRAAHLVLTSDEWREFAEESRPERSARRCKEPDGQLRRVWMRHHARRHGERSDVVLRVWQVYVPG